MLAAALVPLYSQTASTVTMKAHCHSMRKKWRKKRVRRLKRKRRKMRARAR